MSVVASKMADAGVAVTTQDAIDLIWREADLLDRLDYKAWLALWSADGRYIIPVDTTASDHEAVLNIVLDDAAMREARVKRLLSGFSMSSAPPARTVRTVSRFVVDTRDATSVTLRGAMMLVEHKYERTRTLAADVEYRIVATADGLRLDRKVVRLVTGDDALHGIGYLL